jgi:hypothetical protein
LLLHVKWWRDPIASNEQQCEANSSQCANASLLEAIDAARLERIQVDGLIIPFARSALAGVDGAWWSAASESFGVVETRSA